MKDTTKHLGKDCFANIKKVGIVKGQIVEVQKSIRLNTGSSDHVDFLPEKIEYKIRFKNEGLINERYVKPEDIVFDKTEIYKII